MNGWHWEKKKKKKMATALSLFVALLRHPGHHTHCALEGERETPKENFLDVRTAFAFLAEDTLKRP